MAQDPEQGSQQTGDMVDTDPGLLTVLSLWPWACLSNRFPSNWFSNFPHLRVHGSFLFYSLPWAFEFIFLFLYPLTSRFTDFFNSHLSIQPSMYSFTEQVFMGISMCQTRFWAKPTWCQHTLEKGQRLQMHNPTNTQ